MEIKQIKTENSKEWDDIVKSFVNYDVYYLSGYADGFRIHGDGEPVLLYFKDDKTGFRAINVVMKRKISGIEGLQKAGAGYFDILTPYGYGGLLTNEYPIPDIFKAQYTDFCIKNRIVCEFVRFNPMTDNRAACIELYDIRKLGNTVYIDLKNWEHVWGNFTGKNRNVIRKAIKEGVTVCHTDEPWIIDEFMEIYNSTMDRDSASNYYYFKKEYYQSLIDGLKGNFQFFYAIKDGNIAAVSIIIYANKKMHYHLSASRKEFQKFAPTNLLLSEVCRYGVERGFESFHLGGGVGSKEDSLYKFKKAFNKNNDKEYYIGKKIYDINKYNELVEKRTYINDENFFPKYRG